MKKQAVSFLLFSLLIFANVNSQVFLNNVRSYNGTMSASDSYSAIISDNSDNVYAAGYCTDNISAYIIFDKYNSSGTMLWSKTYRSMNNGYDVPVSIALDSSGGIYLAGYSKGLTSSYDFLLIKYNQQGDTIWSRRYNGSSNGEDRAVKVVVDRNNSIILAGNSNRASSIADMVIIKYDLNGNIFWVKKYDCSNHIDDKMNDITLDKNNYIYAATNNNNISGRFSIIKITPSGDTIWTKTVNSVYGTANAIITDDSLNIYATGQITASQDSVSFYTVKLDSSGNTLWCASFNDGPLHRDLAYRINLDELGNVYVAGELTSIITNGKPSISDGYAVIKYNKNGQQLWINRVSGRANVNPICHLKVLNSSNIYFSCLKYFSTENMTRAQCGKLNSNGDTLWIRVLQGQYRFFGLNSFEIDKSGNLLFGSSTYANYGLDASLMKLNSAGNYIWERYFISTGFSADNAISMGKDNQNNLYVTGINAMNYVLIKYNSSFTQQWAVTYSDGSARNEQFSFSANDSLGNVYFTGTTKDTTGNYYVILLKYNSSGNLEWERKYTNNFGQPGAICLDKSGNIVVVITSNDNYNHSTMKILKYNTSGTLLMTTSYNNQYNSSIWITSAETDNDNNILVAGSGDGATTWKYSSSGNLIWVRNWTGTYVHQNNRIKYDRKNNVYVCGVTVTSEPEGYNYLTIKYDSAGNQKWVKTFSGIHNGDDFALDLVNDTLGNTYVTGYAQNNPANWGISTVTIKYDSLGNTLWQREIITPQYGDIRPAMINRDKYNNIYVLCYSNYYQPFNGGYFLAKYNTNGDSIWTYSYSSPYFKYYGKAFLNINVDKIYITGKTYGINTGYDITTLELVQTSGIINVEENIPTKYSLGQNYPNPFNPITNVKFSIIKAEQVKLIVYDIQGREVQTLVNERLQPGTYEVRFDGSMLNSGVYFYKLITGTFSETKKMILLK